MATQLLTLSVLPKGVPIKKIPSDVALPRGAPSSEIYKQISSQTGYSVHRLRITKGSDGTVVPNDREFSLLRTGLLDGSTVHVKDLGMFGPALDAVAFKPLSEAPDSPSANL